MNSINDNENVFSVAGLSRQEDLAPQANTNELGQEDFLSLLTTQLANQDPFEPVDNQAFVAQMAQFSSLSSMQELTTGFNSLAASLASNQALQASALVGRNVYLPTGVGYLEAGGQLEGRTTLAQTTQDIYMDVKNEQGELVRRVNLGAYQQGDLDFSWDGRNEAGEQMPEGKYEVSLFGRVGEQTEQLGTTMRARVSSVNLGGSSGGGVLLNIAGLGQVHLSDVNEVGE